MLRRSIQLLFSSEVGGIKTKGCETLMNLMEIQHEILLVLCWLLAYPVSDNHRFSELPPKLCLVGLEIELSPSSREVRWTSAAQIKCIFGHAAR